MTPYLTRRVFDLLLDVDSHLKEVARFTGRWCTSCLRRDDTHTKDCLVTKVRAMTCDLMPIIMVVEESHGQA